MSSARKTRHWPRNTMSGCLAHQSVSAVVHSWARRMSKIAWHACDGRAVHHAGHRRRHLAGRHAGHRLVEEADAAVALAERDQRLALPHPPEHGQVGVSEALRDRGDLLVRLERRLGIVSFLLPEGDRNQEVAGLDGLPPGLLDRPGRHGQTTLRPGPSRRGTRSPIPSKSPLGRRVRSRLIPRRWRTRACLSACAMSSRPTRCAESASCSSPSRSSGASRSAAIRSSTAVDQAIESYAARARSRSSSRVTCRPVVMSCVPS